MDCQALSGEQATAMKGAAKQTIDNVNEADVTVRADSTVRTKCRGSIDVSID